MDGRLDAWIDFNQDGDWDDMGEQIADSTFVIAGEKMSVRQDGLQLATAEAPESFTKPHQVSWGSGVFGTLRGKLLTKQIVP